MRAQPPSASVHPIRGSRSSSVTEGVVIGYRFTGSPRSNRSSIILHRRTTWTLSRRSLGSMLLDRDAIAWATKALRPEDSRRSSGAFERGLQPLRNPDRVSGS